MFEITLERKLSIECYKIIATLLVHSKKRYPVPVLMHADDNDGKTTVQSCTKELFQKFQNVCPKILDKCVEYELMEKDEDDYILTDKGRDAIKEDKVYTPEDRIWKIHYTDDSLIKMQYKILKYEPDKDNVEYEEDSRSGKRRFKQDQARIRELPNDIMNLNNEQRFKPIFGNKEYFQIKMMESEGKKIKTEIEDITISWTISKDSSNLKLNDISISLPDDLDHRAIWESLIEKAIVRDDYNDEYDAIDLDDFNDRHDPIDLDNLKEDKLLIRYDGATKKEIINMERILMIDGYVDKYGEFGETKIKIPLYPQHSDDAKKWANHLLINEIQNYQTKNRYDELTEKIKKKFPDFSDITLMRREDIPKDKLSRKWYIQAMEDWKL